MSRVITKTKTKTKTKTISAFVGLIFTTLCTSLFLSCTNTYADSITVSMDTSDLIMNLTPKTIAGDFAVSNNATISVTNTSGHILSLASSISTNLTSGVNTVSSVSSSITQADFSNPNNTNYKNKWGYKPSQYVIEDDEIATDNTGNNATFRPLPDAN